MFRAFAAEFPNDNEELHMGTIWRNESPCGRPEAFTPVLEEDPEDTGEPIEIVDTIEMDEPVEIVPAPAVSEVVLTSAAAELIAAGMVIPPPPRLPDISFDVLEMIEANDEHQALEDEAIAVPDAAATAAVDPYAVFLRTLADVADVVGAPIALPALELALGADPIASAWRAILRSESEDFSLCATTLDEWASITLAALASAPSRTAQIRRELRARGVAAFGLVLEAA